MSSGTRLNRLAKGAFVKFGSIAWDVWIHACSHGFSVVAMALKASMVVLQWCFC